MEMTIRPVSMPDLDALLDLYQHLNAHDPRLPLREAEARLAEILAYPGIDILGAFRDGRLVASCTLIVIPNLTRGGAPYALIEDVVTHTDFRGLGFGRAVLQRAVDQAFKGGCYKVMLMTGRTDPGVRHFYESSGFVQSKTGFQVRNPAP